MASAATSAPQPAEAKSCGRTQDKLDCFLKDARSNRAVPEMFTDYFFTNDQAPPPFAKRGDVPSSVVRCFKCGCTIDEHSIGSPPIQVPRQPRQNPHGYQAPSTHGPVLDSASVKLAHLMAAFKPFSNTLPSCDSQVSTFRKKQKLLQCWVCGFTSNTSRGKCGTSLRLASGVAVAHILRNKEEALALRVP